MKNILVKKITVLVFAIFTLSNATAKNFKVQKEHKLSAGTFVEYKLKNDIPVFINTEVPNQVNAVYIIVKGGNLCLSPEFSGLESSCFEMMTYGSKKYSKSEIQSLGYLTQSGIGHYSLYSGSVFTLSCINYYMEQLLPVYLDCFFNPSFEEKDFALLKDELDQKVTQSKNDPESILFEKIRQQVYENSPLLTSSQVKENSFENITIENIKKHHEKILDASRIEIVAVGKYDVQKFLSELNKTLGKLKKSDFKMPEMSAQKLNIGVDKVVVNHPHARGAEMAVRVFESPSVLSEDYVCGQIVSDIFSTTMFNVIREKYGACYTPASQIESSFNPIGLDYGVKVSDMENFEKYFNECVELMKNGKVISSVENGVENYDTIENVLEGYKNSYITKKYTSQSTSSGIAGRVVSSILQFGDLTTADKIPSRALNVTAGDVARVFEKYWCGGESQWYLLLGDEK